MGVPSLFRTLVNSFPNIIYWDETKNVDYLLLDYNCLIHHCVHLAKSDKDEDIIDKVIEYTTHIVNIIQPNKVLYIAIDGTVPMGKMYKQRNRRYKKIYDDRTLSKLKNKWSVENKSFDTTCISPGTEFMSKLSNRIKNYIQIGAFHTQNNKSKYTIIFSDSSVPGEGEFKIFEFIRNIVGDKQCVIYGLDADLIMLSIISKINGILLLREAIKDDVTTEFEYFDIDVTKLSFLKHYQLLSHDTDTVFEDLNILLMLGGNDFVQSFINTRIRENGFKKLMKAYTALIDQNIQNKYLYDKENESVNMTAFSKLIELLLIDESTEMFLESRIKPYFAKKEDIVTYEQDKSNYEHLHYSCKNNMEHHLFDQYTSLMKSKADTIVDVYKIHYFNGNDINQVCNEYIKSIIWTINYYKGKILSHDFYYKYSCAPFMEDLIEYLKRNKNIVIEFEKGTFYSPLEQLLIILPYESRHLLPLSYALMIKETEIIQNFKLDMIDGLKNIYSEPILPDINYDRLNFMSLLPVNLSESKRNTINNKPYIKQFNITQS